MKKRLLSFLLLLTLLVSAMPLGAFSFLSFATEDEGMSEEDYNALYVKQNLLFQFDFFPLNEYWGKAEEYGTIEVAATGAATDANVLAWLKKFVVSNTATPVFRLEHGTGEHMDAEGTYSPHIPFLIKDGYVQFKEPDATVGSAPPYLQVYFSQAYTPGVAGFGMESLISYDAVVPGVKSSLWLPWAFSLTPAISLSDRNAFTIVGSKIWSANYTLDSQPVFTHNGKPFSLAYNIETDGSTSSAAILANGTTLTTGTIAKADGGNTVNIGYFYGSHGMKLYGMRLYDCVLSAEELRQNHFADIAKYFCLDVSDFAATRRFCSAEALDAYYAAFAELDFTATRDEAQAVADEAFAVLDTAPVYPEITAEGYNSLYVAQDLLFQMDFFALNDFWGKAADYGTITAASTSAATKTAVLTWLNKFIVKNPGKVDMLVQGTKGDDGATDFEHQIPFRIKNGYIQYKNVSDGYAYNNNNPYLQFKPTSTDVYNNGGFTWEIQMSLDEYSKSGTVFLPALSDLRPRMTTSSPKTAFTVTGANGTAYTTANAATLNHMGKSFDLTYRLETSEGSYKALLSSGGTTIGEFSATTAFAGAVCDIGWNFSASDAKIYAVRLYDRALTDAELCQNHFADLAKHFRLDVTGLLEYSPLCKAEDLEAYYSAFAALDFTSVRSDVQAVADAAFAVLKESVAPVENSTAYYDALYVKRDLLFRLDFFPLNSVWKKADEYGTITAADTSAATKSAVVAWLNQFVVENPGGVSMVINGTNGDSGATDFEHQIPFRIKEGYIQYKNISDGYTITNNNPYLQFKPSSTAVYNSGGFTWEMHVSFDEFSKTGTFWLPALSDLRPVATTSSPKTAFTVTGASGFTVLSTGALTHGGKSFDLTYRTEAKDGSYDAVLSSASTTLGKFSKTTAYAGAVCDFGWNFNESDAKIYAVRLYDRALSDAELRQNHFADLAKYFRLDLGDFASYSDADKQRIYSAFTAYDLETASYAALQKAYTDLAVSMAIEKYEAHYLEGAEYAAHNAFIDACIEKATQNQGDFLAITAIYALPLSARGDIYALSGDALTQEAIMEAVSAYWTFDEEEYRSYDRLYYDAGNLVTAYDFFALSSYWNADRAEGYLPTSKATASWESQTGTGGRYFDRFSVKGRLNLLCEGGVIPFTIPVAGARGMGGFVLLGEGGRAADAFAASGLGSTVTAEAVLRVDAATDALFSLSGVCLGIKDGVYTAPSGMHNLTGVGIGAAATLGGATTYSLVLTHAGLGGAVSLSLSEKGTEVFNATGTAMADATGKTTLGQDQSLAGAVYAIRYYRTVLTEAQMAQNHFADIAKFYRLDLPNIDLILTSASAAASLYAAMADYGFDESREQVQKTYDDYCDAFLLEHEGLAALRAEAAAIVNFEGYQVRVAGTEGAAPDAYAGMRAVFTVDSVLLAALESEGYTVLVDVLTRNAQKDHSYFGRAVAVPIYNGKTYVAKGQSIDGVGGCFVVTVVYATKDDSGNMIPFSDALVSEMMLYNVAYEYVITATKDDVTYVFTFQATSEKFGDTVNAKEIYHYFGKQGDGDMQGFLRDDTLVKKMLELTPPEESAITAPTVGRLTLASDAEAHYTVTLPGGATDAVCTAAKAFASKLSTLTGVDFAVVGEAGVRRDCEIVIASGSDRADAVEFAAAAAAEGLGYAIGVSGKRILVYAADDTALSDALAVLYASVTDNRTDDVIGDNANNFYLPAMLSVKKSGAAAAAASDYSIVVPDDMGAMRLAKVNEYVTALAERTGITLTVATDSMNVAGQRILVMTAADNDAAAALLASSSYTGYAIASVGDDIVVSAYSDIALRAAFSALFATVSDEGRIPTDVTVKCDFGAGEGIPHLATGGTLNGGTIYDAGGASYTASYVGVSEAEYLAYCALLAEHGLVLLGENEKNGCLFATYKADGCGVILAFYPMLSKMTVTIQPEGTFLPTGEAAAYVENPDITPSVTLMDHELASYVMQLEDGSFLIVDGGDLNRAGAMDKMWEHLASLTPEGQKPVISLWMATHGHSDHVILMTEFLAAYHDDLVLKAVAFNFPNYESLDVTTESIHSFQGHGIAEDAQALCSMLDIYYPDVVRWIPRTGQKHAVAGAEIEILYSHEDYYPAQVAWGNDTSSAWRITLGGQSIVYLGDCTDPLCRQMAAVYGDTLESDILQVTHHGVGSGDLGLYELIDPRICLWGTSITEFAGDRCNGTGSYTVYNYNTWIRTTEWTRTVNGVTVSGAREHYHGSVRTTLPLILE